MSLDQHTIEPTPRDRPKARTERPGRTTLHRGVHAALMLAAMVPCLLGSHDLGLHAACAFMMVVLLMRSAVRTRRDPRSLPEFADDLVMCVLLIAMVLRAPVAGGHHGAAASAFTSLSAGEGLAIAAVALWLFVRLEGWRELERPLATATFGFSLAMVALMVFRVIGG